MKKITGPGYIVGAFFWLAIMWYATTKSACLQEHSCQGDDLFLFAILGIGMLGPAWLAASFISSVFGPK